MPIVADFNCVKEYFNAVRRILTAAQLQEVNIMVVQHNLTAINANRYLGINNKKLSKSLEKLSSGYAINRAGDNAAGLAVSEKMRSQIAGMTQGVKNAQDGISMVQTFEGALTETHSILQRMKTLADQMGNGTYDDPIDRTAAQQEFLQLNDELDQIADTDFNGVVALNGGVMADGAVADKNGLIDYANQPERAAQAWTASDVNTLDSKGYDSKQASADSLWDNLGLSEDVESLDITFTYNKDSETWTATDASDSTAFANLANIKIIRAGSEDPITAAGSAITQGAGNGGFSVVSTATAANTGDKQLGDAAPAAYAANAGYEYANVVLDTTKLVDGDTVTLNFTRPKTGNSAPENIGVKDGNVNVTKPDGVALTEIKDPTLVVNGGDSTATFNYESTNIESADLEADKGTKPMTQAAADAFNSLNGATVDVTYIDKADKSFVIDAVTITLADGKSVKVANGTSGTGSEETGSLISEDGIKYDLTKAANGTLTIKDAAGVELVKITPGAITATAGDTTAGNEAVHATFQIGLDTATYSNKTEPKVTIKGEEEYAVSKSNAFDKSEAQLTYKDSITLQVGARTKDAVNFTFKYASTAIGDLEADLNCTAKGLGTDKLNLNTQESANYAIDKIDQAINKVSLIRGTFGAIQNRLDHKIDNMNVSIENLTSAESQIRDTNMAEEMMNFTKQQILAQASQSMLAQANQLPQGVLSLLQ